MTVRDKNFGDCSRLAHRTLPLAEEPISSSRCLLLLHQKSQINSHDFAKSTVLINNDCLTYSLAEKRERFNTFNRYKLTHFGLISLRRHLRRLLPSALPCSGSPERTLNSIWPPRQGKSISLTKMESNRVNR